MRDSRTQKRQAKRNDREEQWQSLAAEEWSSFFLLTSSREKPGKRKKEEERERERNAWCFLFKDISLEAKKQIELFFHQLFPIFREKNRKATKQQENQVNQETKKTFDPSSISPIRFGKETLAKKLRKGRITAEQFELLGHEALFFLPVKGETR